MHVNVNKLHMFFTGGNKITCCCRPNAQVGVTRKKQYRNKQVKLRCYISRICLDAAHNGLVHV